MAFLPSLVVDLGPLSPSLSLSLSLICCLLLSLSPTLFLACPVPNHRMAAHHGEHLGSWLPWHHQGWALSGDENFHHRCSHLSWRNASTAASNAVLGPPAMPHVHSAHRLVQLSAVLLVQNMCHRVSVILAATCPQQTSKHQTPMGCGRALAVRCPHSTSCSYSCFTALRISQVIHIFTHFEMKGAELSSLTL